MMVENRDKAKNLFLKTVICNMIIFLFPTKNFNAQKI